MKNKQNKGIKNAWKVLILKVNISSGTILEATVWKPVH